MTTGYALCFEKKKLFEKMFYLETFENLKEYQEKD